MLNNISISLLSSPYEEQYTWKRVISVIENISLTDLHLIMQALLKFDDDHLFQFLKNGVSLDADQFIESHLHCKRHYHQLKLNEVLTDQNHRLIYNFDFGDCWVFDIKQTLNSPLRINKGNYKIISKVGRKMRQYPKCSSIIDVV